MAGGRRARGRALRGLVLAAAVITSGGATACGGGAQAGDQGGSSVSMASYGSVDELSRAADVVAVGTVLDQGVASLDHGLDPPPTDGAPRASIPVRVFRVRVDSTIASRRALPEVLSVVIPTVSVADGVDGLPQGKQLVMFMLYFAQTGVEGLTDAWVPVSYDNGEFEVAGQTVTARSQTVRRLTTAGTEARSLLLTTTLGALRRTVKAAGLAT